LNVLQHRAWEIFSKTQKNMKGLWSFVTLIACTLIQLNLALNFELNLVDLKTEEAAIIYSFLEACTNVKLFVLNEQISFMKDQKKISPIVANEIRNEIMVTAIEHSAVQACLDVMRQLSIKPGEITYIFQLRSIPLRAFILPKTVSEDEYIKSIPAAESTATITHIDKALMWIEKATKNFESNRIDGTIISGNLLGLKKALITNKMKIIKGATKNSEAHLRNHTILVSLS